MRHETRLTLPLQFFAEPEPAPTPSPAPTPAPAEPAPDDNSPLACLTRKHLTETAALRQQIADRDETIRLLTGGTPAPRPGTGTQTPAPAPSNNLENFKSLLRHI